MQEEMTAIVEKQAAHCQHLTEQLLEKDRQIGELTEEVARLNRENFWLSQGDMIRVPPLKTGDRAWGIGRNGGNRYVHSGKVTLLEIVDGQVVINVRSVCRGLYGKQVFGSAEEAQAALERMKEGV